MKNKSKVKEKRIVEPFPAEKTPSPPQVINPSEGSKENRNTPGASGIDKANKTAHK